MKLWTGKTIKQAEDLAAQKGMTHLRMMENAGSAAAKVIRDQYSVAGTAVTVLAGKGNNGGDGLVVARKLCEAGAMVRVILCCGAPSSDDAQEMLGRCRNLDITFCDYTVDEQQAALLLKTSDVIVDAVFGTGFHGAPPAELETLFTFVNSLPAPVVALDMPSGANADTGEVASACVRADCTVSFSGKKAGQVQYPAAEYVGHVLTVEIGLPADSQNSVLTHMHEVEKAMAFSSFPKRPANSHKGTFGTAALFCGSRGMAGAAVLSAKSALRCGAGLVRLSLPEEIYPIAASQLTEAVLSPLLQTKSGTFSRSALERALQTAKSATACLVGCGLGENPETEGFVQYFLENCETPMVLDADGINSLRGNITILKAVKAPLVLTPHPGEMSRLIGKPVKEINADRVGIALRLAEETGAVVVLKGAATVTACPAGEAFINPTGNSGMAKGGSGDVLAGMIVSFMAQGMSAASASVCGVYLHGLAGDRAASRLSRRGMLPSDMIGELPGLLLEIEAVGESS